jgi:hypothetical protein
MRRVRDLTLVLATAALGCTAQLTRAGAEVRPVPPEQTYRCTYVGAVEGTGANGPSVADNENVATVDVRNRVAKLGGNAFVITGRSSHAWHSVVRADGYRCPQWEPVPGLAPVEAPRDGTR